MEACWVMMVVPTSILRSKPGYGCRYMHGQEASCRTVVNHNCLGHQVSIRISVAVLPDLVEDVR